MIIYLKREYKSIVYGIIAYCIFYALNEFCGYVLFKSGVTTINSMSSNETLNCSPILIFSTLISTSLLIVPAFIAGWFAVKDGLINALFLIFICNTIIYVFSLIKWSSYPFDFIVVYVYFHSLIVPLAGAAVSGAAGELYSKKNKL